MLIWSELQNLDAFTFNLHMKSLRRTTSSYVSGFLKLFLSLLPEEFLKWKSLRGHDLSHEITLDLSEAQLVFQARLKQSMQ